MIGHETAGVVEKVGSDVTYVKPGDHVVTCLSVFCGTCDNCTTGRTVLCTDTTVKMLPGASNRLSWARSEKLNQFLNLSSFAEQMLVHENAIVKIRNDMPLDLAALIGCGVITGFGGAAFFVATELVRHATYLSPARIIPVTSVCQGAVQTVPASLPFILTRAIFFTFPR